MKHSEVGPGLFDDNVQKNIASLEQARERIVHMADSARDHYGAITRQIGAVRQTIADARQGRTALQGLIARETEQLTQLAQDGADPTAIAEAAERLADRKAELMVGLHLERLCQEQLAVLEQDVQGLSEMADDGLTLAGDVAASIDFLAANFRELGSWVESAQQSRALGLHIIRAQEEERRRLAREIHDGPTQLLNSVVLRIDVCQRFFDSDLQRLKDELQQLKELVRLSLQDVRKIIFDLRPMALDDLGVVPALRTFLKDYQARTGIETDFSVFGNDRRYDPAFEIAIFRVVQEALTNVYKHAGASRVWVKVETAGGREIKVQVKDDGAGFEPAEVKPGVAGTKFGLVAMRERTELLGGTMEIQSAPGQGTKLNLIFPLPE
ncbi:MAG TPA: sensor histidine kinase [Symbiobacteriaceae bacterium]|nr:sensor histidine kinase [Symbiobacteriaceae bacterium]